MVSGFKIFTKFLFIYCKNFLITKTKTCKLADYTDKETSRFTWRPFISSLIWTLSSSLFFTYQINLDDNKNNTLQETSFLSICKHSWQTGYITIATFTRFTNSFEPVKHSYIFYLHFFSFIFNISGSSSPHMTFSKNIITSIVLVHLLKISIKFLAPLSGTVKSFQRGNFVII